MGSLIILVLMLSRYIFSSLAKIALQHDSGSLDPPGYPLSPAEQHQYFRKLGANSTCYQKFYEPLFAVEEDSLMRSRSLAKRSPDSARTCGNLNAYTDSSMRYPIYSHKTIAAQCQLAREAGLFNVTCARHHHFFTEDGQEHTVQISRTVHTWGTCAPNQYCFDFTNHYNDNDEPGLWPDVSCRNKDFKGDTTSQFYPEHLKNQLTTYSLPMRSNPKYSVTRGPYRKTRARQLVLYQAEVLKHGTNKPYKVESMYFDDHTNPRFPLQHALRHDSFETDFTIAIYPDFPPKKITLVVEIAAGHIPALVIHTLVLFLDSRRSGRIGGPGSVTEDGLR